MREEPQTKSEQRSHAGWVTPLVWKGQMSHRHDSRGAEGMKRNNRRRDPESRLAQGDILLLYFILPQNAARPSTSLGEERVPQRVLTRHFPTRWFYDAGASRQGAPARSASRPPVATVAPDTVPRGSWPPGEAQTPRVPSYRLLDNPCLKPQL